MTHSTSSMISGQTNEIRPVYSGDWVLTWLMVLRRQEAEHNTALRGSFKYDERSQRVQQSVLGWGALPIWSLLPSMTCLNSTAEGFATLRAMAYEVTVARVIQERSLVC